MATWQSILCDQRGWSHPTVTGLKVVFHDNGTGELYCRLDPQPFIGAKFAWKTVGEALGNALQRPVGMVENSETEHIQATVDIELTLSTEVPMRMQESYPPDLNKVNLAASAFRPKLYRLQLAIGKFNASTWRCINWLPPDHDFGDGGIKGYYEFQLMFDKSPYPELEEWREQNNEVDRAVKAARYWELRDFYRNYLDPNE